MQFALVIGTTAILMVELLLWLLFRRKLKGLDFPHERDASSFRLLSRGGLAALSVMHSVALATAYACTILFLW